MVKRMLTVVAALAALTLAVRPAAAQQAVDLELVLAVDASASISDGALEFQLRGHAAAFRDPAVAQAIASGPIGAIGVTVVTWAEPHSLRVLVPWTRVANADAAASFADAIETAPREARTGSTAIGSAIDEAAALFADSGFSASRRSIDLCSNGFSNSGQDPQGARDRAAAQDITINALAILDEYPWLEEYFQENVIGGPSAFVKTAEDRESFAQAILQKLVQEIVALPSESRVAALAAHPLDRKP